MFLEQQKLYMRHWEEMLNNRPKLYAMIWQYLSQESKEEVKRSQDYEVQSTPVYCRGVSHGPFATI
jgi:hypothetical protein